MMILSGFRDITVGTDTINYYYNFYEEGHATDFVWSFLRLSIQNLGLGYHHFLILVSVLTYSIFGYVIRKVLPPSSIPFAILLFIVGGNQYFIQSFNTTRQILATMFLLLTFCFMYDKKYIKAVISYVVATGIHASSIIYLPFILCAQFVRLSYKIVDVVLVVLVIYAFLFSNINVSYLGNALILAIPFLDLEYYADYLDNDMYSHGFSVMGMLTLIPLRCIAASIVYKVLNGNIFSRIYFVGAVALCLLTPVFFFTPRAVMGLIACEMIVIPMAINKKLFAMYSKSRQRYLCQKCFFSIYILFYGYLLAIGLLGDYTLPENLGNYKFY